MPRLASAVLAGALVVGVAAGTTGTASAAQDAADDRTGGWLESQLTGGLIHNNDPAFGGFDDYGLTADTGMALAAVGGHGKAVKKIRGALAKHVDSWTTGADFGSTDIYAGSVAKAVVLAQSTGANPKKFGGVNLVTRLNGLVSADKAIAGRIQDKSSFGDYANTLGQAFAVGGLATAKSAKAPKAAAFLLQQQCDAGYFRLYFADASAADQTCDGAAKKDRAADTDATAIALINLASIEKPNAKVTRAITAATRWLMRKQKADGSFGGGPTTKAPNANSTGLAGWALGEVGRAENASKAAVWVRAHQVTNVGACAPYAKADVGAIAYDDAALADLVSTPIAPDTQDKFRRSTAQALPVLQWAAAGLGTEVLFTAEYVRAGSKTQVGVIGAAPGETLCAKVRGQKVAAVADVHGEAQLPVRLPAKTATTVVKVYDASGRVGKASINALGAKELTVSLQATVRMGTDQTVRVTGLAPAESVKIKLLGRTITGQASAKGFFMATAQVTGEPGTSKVTVTGEFGNRTGSKTFKVVR
jgi:hypothetical protein